MIKAVLFDMDGVLIDAREWHYEALNKALEIFWYTITRHEHEKFYDWLPTHIKLNKLSEEKWLPKSLHKFINQMKQQYTVDAIYNNSNVDFSKQVMLKKLRDKWIKIACCSNSIKNSIEMMLNKAMIIDYFDLILSNEDVSESKPSPQIYNLAIEKLWVKPEETLIVEDSAHWIEAANKSWARVIIVDNAIDVHSWIFNKYNLINLKNIC